MSLRITFTRFLAVLLLLPCGSCGTVGKLMAKKEKTSKEDKKDDGKRDTVIGTIELVNPEQKFVLIRAQGRYIIQPGTKLHALSESGVKSVLQISPESKQTFLSADILEGFPQRGHTVIVPYDPTAETGPPSTVATDVTSQTARGTHLWAPEDDPVPGVPPGARSSSAPGNPVPGSIPAPGPSAALPPVSIPLNDVPPIDPVPGELPTVIR